MGPEDIANPLALNYGLLSQTAGEDARRRAAQISTGAVAANQAAGDATINPFNGLKAGETKTFNSFVGNQVGDPTKGGMTVISGKPSAAGMFATLRTQGYTPDEAMKAVGIFADADLNKTKMGLLPDEAKATNTLTYAQAGLADANRGNVTMQTSLMPKVVDSEIQLRRDQGFLARGQGKQALSSSSALDAETSSQNRWNSFLGMLGKDEWMRMTGARKPSGGRGDY